MEITTFNYLIEWAIGIIFFYLMYYFLLRNETFFKLNRLFLMVSLFLSAIIPVLHFQTIDIKQDGVYSIMLETVNIGGEISNLSHEPSTISVLETFFKLYISVVILLTIRFLIKLLSIYKLIVQFGIERVNGKKIAFVDSQFSGFSFFDVLFISNDIRSNKKLEEILQHETVHINQLHTLDILVIELVTIIQWFNPFVWFYRKALKQTHEYLADRGVLEQGFDSGKYQMLLLQQQIGVQPSLANNFNKSLTLKRLIMLNKKESRRFAGIKFLAMLPIVWFMLFVFSCDKAKEVTEILEVENEISSENSKIEVQPIFFVDGVEKQSIDNIEPSQIESLNVYKGEEAIKKYGEKGKNGVISIVLKKNTGIITETIKTSENGDMIFLIVDEMPQFPGGDIALSTFIAQNVKYPESAREASIFGKVYVRFVVTKLGKVEQVKIARGVHEDLDKESIRVVSMLPDWTPGKQRGKAVDVYYTVPIQFSLQ